MFYPEKCNTCGYCFIKCPYVDYTFERAVTQIQTLKQGKDADILKDCVSCMACNEFCPEDANPFDLICALRDKRSKSRVPE